MSEDQPVLASPGAAEEYRAAVASYVAAGGEESVQRTITAIYGLTRKLDKWYAVQLADLDLTHGEWSVLAQLAKADGHPVTPSRLAGATGCAASSMTHRLDKMAGRGLVERTPDPANRTRVLVTLTDEGWQLFSAAIREANVTESDTLAALDADQRRTLADLLERLIVRLDEIDTD